MVAASGTLAAIAQAFASKSNAMKRFARGLQGGSPRGNDSKEMGRMRDRIQNLIREGAA